MLGVGPFALVDNEVDPDISMPASRRDQLKGTAYFSSADSFGNDPRRPYDLSIWAPWKWRRIGDLATLDDPRQMVQGAWEAPWISWRREQGHRSTWRRRKGRRVEVMEGITAADTERWSTGDLRAGVLSVEKTATAGVP